MEETSICEAKLLLEQTPGSKAGVAGRGAFVTRQILCLEMANPFLFPHTVGGICTWNPEYQVCFLQIENIC